MICPVCKQYVPEGLGLKNCLECHADLTSALSTTQQPSATPKHEESNDKPLLPASHASATFEKSSALRYPDRKAWIWILALIVIPVVLILFPRSGRSYYIDGDKTVSWVGIPDNRIFQFKGDFFYLTVHYPEDMYTSVLGTEVFLTKGGATHFLKIAVTNRKRGGLPVRYRVRSIKLTSGDKEHPFLLFQTSLYTDEIKKQSVADAYVGNLVARNVLQHSAELLPKLDFTPGFTNIDELYFGYELKKPPQKLLLSFEIEVYQLGGEPKEVVKEIIDLTRVDGDPLDYIKRQTRRRP